LLTEVLAQNPTDAFARYGLAMEYSNSGEVERALEEFGRLLATHPDYTRATSWPPRPWPKLSAPKKLEDAGGRIACARKTGNGHAQSEMEGMLAELE